jgi:tetratricopeptide (TPR) repeat protein
MDRGDFAAARQCYEQQLEIATRIGNQQGVIHAVGNLGNVYLDQHSYSQALNYYQQALDTTAQIGYMQAACVLVGNMSEIYRQQGDYERSLKCCEQALAIALELGDWAGVFTTLGNIAIVYTAQKRYAEAKRLFGQAINLGRKLGYLYFLCEYLYEEAYLLTLQEDYLQAQALNDETLEIAAQVERRDIQFKARVLSIQLRFWLKQADKSTTLNRLERLLTEWSENNEQAAIYFTIWQLENMRENARQTAASLYHALYDEIPNIEYRERYEILTGTTLPEPDPLPAPPEDITHNGTPLETLIEQVASLSKNMF